LLLVANKFQTGFDQPLLCGMYLDRRLAGIQAVQTLSRLNRAHPGKDTTYILDFANSADEVLAAFRTYYETAQLEGVTDPNIIFDLRAKLDGGGWYDTFEVETVVKVLMDPKASQGQLQSALAPVADRLLKRFSAAKAKRASALEGKDEAAVQEAKDEMDALDLFKRDLGAFIRLYAFLSQMFDYGNTDIEKRYLFYKHLVRLLDFGRERDTVDLSQITLTHHAVKPLGKAKLILGDGEPEKIVPIGEVGSGSVQEKQKARLREIVDRLNELFGNETTDEDQVVFVMDVLKGKILQSKDLQQQAEANSEAQFAASPTLDAELMNAIIDAMDAHQKMSQMAIDSLKVRAGLKDILLGPGKLYEALRARRGTMGPTEPDHEGNAVAPF
ncbi:MAG: type I restriction endonuclease subunit R, partial [Sphingomonadaceae bacterium]